MQGATTWIARGFTSRYLREILYVLTAYTAYYFARHEALSDAGKAFENAAKTIRLEQSIGIFKEVSLQSAAFSYGGLVHVFNVIYFYGHWPVIIAAGVYLFIKSPSVYAITRSAFLLSGSVALLAYALFPVAPPRLIPGFVDTLSLTIPVSYDNSPWFNPYAAVPSLHVGFDFLVSLGVFCAVRNWLVRTLAILLTPAMLLATVVTGNHYFIDGVAGAALCGAAFLVASWLNRRWPDLRARFLGQMRRRRVAAM